MCILLAMFSCTYPHVYIGTYLYVYMYLGGKSLVITHAVIYVYRGHTYYPTHPIYVHIHICIHVVHMQPQYATALYIVIYTTHIYILHKYNRTLDARTCCCYRCRVQQLVHAYMCIYANINLFIEHTVEHTNQ